MFSFIPNAEIQSRDTFIFAVNHHHHHHRRQPHMMKLQFLPLSLPHPNTNPKPRLKSTKISCKKYEPSRFRYYPPYIPPSTPPRDATIDFGKYKGRMLGTLPSSYLKWVSEKFKDDRDFKFWANLADKVLEDPVYKDRIEWDMAQNNGWSFKEMTERFDWDSGRNAKWRGIKFELLGTSFGGRIPRIDPNRPVESEFPPKREKPRAAGGEGSAREKRRERRRSKSSERSSEGRLKLATAGYVNGGDDGSEGEGDEDPTVEVVQKKGFPGREDFGRVIEANRTAEDVHQRFPGRESLFKIVIDRNKLTE